MENTKRTVTQYHQNKKKKLKTVMIQMVTTQKLMMNKLNDNLIDKSISKTTVKNKKKTKHTFSVVIFN